MSSSSFLSPVIEKLADDIKVRILDLTEAITSGQCEDHARYLAECARRNAYLDVIDRIENPTKPRTV